MKKINLVTLIMFLLTNTIISTSDLKNGPFKNYKDDTSVFTFFSKLYENKKRINETLKNNENNTEEEYALENLTANNNEIKFFTFLLKPFMQKSPLTVTQNFLNKVEKKEENFMNKFNNNNNSISLRSFIDNYFLLNNVDNINNIDDINLKYNKLLNIAFNVYSAYIKTINLNNCLIDYDAFMKEINILSSNYLDNDNSYTLNIKNYLLIILSEYIQHFQQVN